MVRAVKHLLNERFTVREVPCAGCGYDRKRKRMTGKRGSGLLHYTGGPDKGKLATCVGCDGTGYEYKCLVLSTMECPIDL